MAAAATRAAIDPDRSYDDYMAALDRMRAKDKAKLPGVDLGAQVAGSIAGMAPLAATMPGALGITGTKLVPRMVKAGTSGAALTAADQLVRKRLEGPLDAGDVADVGKSALISGGISSVIPAGEDIGRGLGRIANERIIKPIRAGMHPKKAAAERVIAAIDADRAAARPGSVVTPADELTAQKYNQPIANVDLGGEQTRALARSAANVNTGARQQLTDLAEDRFKTQSPRVIKFFRRLTGNQVDDLAQLDKLRTAAVRQNAVQYNAAYSSPRAQGIWSSEIADLMQSPAMQKAVRMAESRAADRGAVKGAMRVKNPFTTDKAGNFILRTNKDGSKAVPTLQFWDQVQRNLREAGQKAKSKSPQRAAELSAIRKQLNEYLDRLVPEFNIARRGAAAAFGAEDALEAGKKFATVHRQNPEFKRVIQKMKPAERKLFQTGFASEMIDQAKAVNDRSDLIRQFLTPELREKMRLTFGATKARELESFIRVEQAMNALRGALGNSTTSRQLIEAGVIGGSAFLYTGDWQTGLWAGLGRLAVGKGVKKLEERYVANMAKLLVGGPADLARAQQLAASSRPYMAAVDALSLLAESATRGAAIKVPEMVE
jgi:hypothetical protein